MFGHLTRVRLVPRLKVLRRIRRSGCKGEYSLPISSRVGRPVYSWQRRLCLRVADLIGGRRSSHRFGASCIGACSAAWHRLAHTGVLCA